MSAPPAVVSLTQGTEVGTIYQPDQIAAICRPYTAALRSDRNGPHCRFVTAWNSTADAVDQFVAAASGRTQTGGAA